MRKCSEVVYLSEMVVGLSLGSKRSCPGEGMVLHFLYQCQSGKVDIHVCTVHKVFTIVSYKETSLVPSVRIERYK